MTKGFTLIELLVVVLIIGILAAVAVPQYQKAVQKTRFTQLVTASKVIMDAQNAYYLANGRYSFRADELAIEYPMSADGSKFQTSQWECGFWYTDRTSCTLNIPHIALQWNYADSGALCCAYADDDWQGEAFCKQWARPSTTQYTNPQYRCYVGRH